MTAHAEKPDVSVNMKMSAEFVTRIDDWRRVQPKLPSRNEAIRVLVSKALETEHRQNGVRIAS